MHDYQETTQEEKVLLALRLIVAGYIPSDVDACFGLCHFMYQRADYDTAEISIERLDSMYSGFEYYSDRVSYPIASPDYDDAYAAYHDTEWTNTPMYGEGEYARRRRELAQHLINYITRHGLPPIY